MPSNHHNGSPMVVLFNETSHPFMNNHTPSLITTYIKLYIYIYIYIYTIYIQIIEINLTFTPLISIMLMYIACTKQFLSCCLVVESSYFCLSTIVFIIFLSPRNILYHCLLQSLCSHITQLHYIFILVQSSHMTPFGLRCCAIFSHDST